MAKTLDSISESRRLLQNPYAYLNDVGGFSALQHYVEAEKKQISVSRRNQGNPYAYLDEFGGFSADVHFDWSHEVSLKKKGRYSFDEIEHRVRVLQLKMWQSKSQIWAGVAPSNPIDILDPTIALKLIGYNADLDETLGQFHSDGKLLEVAGIIDSELKQVNISRQFASNIRSFTAAHELGHALLHETGRMHRDRPLDGATSSRSRIELEADKFATFFLMPSKLVQATFKRFFLTDKFRLDEATAFALGVGDNGKSSSSITSLRQLSRLLASAERYNGLQFISLASQFDVSVEAMAIRLEELELLAV